MVSVIPITLVGENLGVRHRHLNSLVFEASQRDEPFKTLQALPERSAVDRLFKIDLASKLRRVDYIITNLKDDDMLYVSRALKSKWLFDSKYRDIINPLYLEDVLYPQMVTTAVNKMKHWIHLNLQDQKRCQEFYQYYYEKSFDLAKNFLWNCSVEFILNATPKIVNKLSPHYFKILCEKCPQFAKIYFDSLPNDEQLLSQYLNKEQEYYSCLKCVLKSNADIYLDITERYFNKNRFDRFSPAATKYIMSHHKSRFANKPELYAAWLLDMKTLAQCINSDECKKLVLKLARASYLSPWFSYKEVEPLIKRLATEERAPFKKKVFVVKDIGDEAKDWPYPPPSPPKSDVNPKTNVFQEYEHSPTEYQYLGEYGSPDMLKRLMCAQYLMMNRTIASRKTQLDRLFDEFRFASFEKTLFELRKRIGAESTPQNRQYMMLVLVSKSGGRAESVASLLQLLARHGNEPPHLRATVVRSLVKRACVWRLPGDNWTQLLDFARGLGMDGNPPEADCREGLHAVVIRSLLSTGQPEPAVLAAYLREFSALVEYTLTPAERQRISELLPEILLAAANLETDANTGVDRIDKLLDTLIAYRLRVDTYPGAVPAIAALAGRNQSATGGILRRLFVAKIARKELFRENFQILEQTDASYLNALRHDTGVISVDKFKELVTADKLQPGQFLRKLAIYFDEKDGLAMRFLTTLKTAEPHKRLARPLTLLLGSKLVTHLQELDKSEDIATKQLAAAIRSNAHVARPQLNLDTFGWRLAGAKLIANRVLICRATELDQRVQELLSWKRTARLAIILAQRTNNEADVFAAVAMLRPNVAIKTSLTYFRRRGENFDLRVWETMKPLLRKLDLTSHSSVHLCRNFDDASTIPLSIRPEYNTIIYEAFRKISYFKSMPMLCHVELLLPDVNEKFIETVLLEFLKDHFVTEMSSDDLKCVCLHLRILVKYLLLCQSEATQSHRFKTVGQPFFDRMESMWKTSEDKEALMECLDEILLALKYTQMFLNVAYVSCLPVMGKVVSWMKRILPLERNFEKYVHVHLTMLYFKAIRQSIMQVREVFKDEKKKLTEGVRVVGEIFGEYIAREANELTSKYFGSIIDLYKDGLESYFQKYFNYNNISDFAAPVIKGILVGSKGQELLLTVYILRQYYYYFKDEVRDEILKCMRERKDIEMQLFLFAEMNTGPTNVVPLRPMPNLKGGYNILRTARVPRYL